MFKALGSLFKSFTTQEALDELTSPAQLSTGDMLRFADGFAIPEELRGETFQVQKVTTYFYTDAASLQFIIKAGDGRALYLSIEDFDGEELIVISRKLKNKEVKALIGKDQLQAAMKNESHREITLNDSGTSDEWLSNDAYARRVFGAKGQYFERDLRDSNSPPNGGESFKYYEYYSADEKRSLEIEVWDGNEIEVSLGLVRPMSDVDELWRKS